MYMKAAATSPLKNKNPLPMIRKAEGGRVSFQDNRLTIKIMASGIRISPATARLLGIKTGERIHYGLDEMMQLFVYRDDVLGTKVSSRYLTESNGLSIELLRLARKDPQEIRQGNSVMFSVEPEPVIEDDTVFHRVIYIADTTGSGK